ncbi:MAG TPA: hypothetical protein VJN70_00455 [Gemmatimonadaceae bacterium]|nr:hypothetical protein [Gemmatimonadaceae bacterium]
MSEHVRPDIEAFRELESLVRDLGEELASYRERALAAETRLRLIDGTADSVEPRTRERIRFLEQENASLRGRLDAATARTRSVLDRVHFLRQQTQADDR